MDILSILGFMMGPCVTLQDRNSVEAKIGISGTMVIFTSLVRTILLMLYIIWTELFPFMVRGVFDEFLAKDTKIIERKMVQ